MEKKFCIINEECGLDCVYKSNLSLAQAEHALCDLINSGLENCYIMDDITEHQSYVAVKESYVIGACFTLSDTAAEWVEDMVFDGAKVIMVDRRQAKEILGTHIDLSILAA